MDNLARSDRSPRSRDGAGLILAECIEMLDALRVEFADDPAGEYRRLAMLALEREQLVSYAYREDILERRLRELVAPAPIVEILRHAFTQVWRDEEAHTIMIRGTLVDDGDGSAGLVRTTAEQTAGLLAGWSSAIKHHVPRSRAPLRTAFVDGLAVAARVVGKLSPDLRDELNHKTFREFCRYNIDAEETAELCWRRLVELDIAIGRSATKTFERIAREENDHGQVFAAVADALDDHDWLRPGVGEEHLITTLAAIGSRFVPYEHRRSGAAVATGSGSCESRFGTGAPVHVFSEASNPRAQSVDRAVALLGPVAGKRVAIKASWMMGYSLDDPSSVVDAEFLELLTDALTDRGASPVLLEAENLYSPMYTNRTVADVARHFGIDAVTCPIVDAATEVVPLSDAGVLGPTQVSREWVDADVRLSVVRLRSHPTEHVHGCTANLESLVLDHNANVFWRRQYDHSAAALAVAIDAPPHLAIVDAWSDCPDGLFGLMAGPHAVHPGRIYASVDAVSCDLVLHRHTGAARSVTSPTLRRVIEWFGDPRSRIEVIGDDTEIASWRHPHHNVVSGLLADLSYPVYSYLSGSGALFVPPMDPEFEEIRPVGAVAGLTRRVARRMLGLHPPK